MARPPVLVKTKGMSHDEFVAARSAHPSLGASDAAAACGLDPWRSRIALFADKTGQAPEREETDGMEIGLLMEPVVATIFSRRTGFPTRNVNAILQHPQYPWMTASLDRRTKDDSARWVPLELKAPNAFKLKEWDDGEVPEHYQLQVQHQLAVTGDDHGWIGAVIGGQTPRWARIERNEAVIRDLIEIEHDFWHDHVLRGIPPAVDGSDATTELLKKLYAEADEDSAVIWDDTDLEIVRRYWAAHQAMELAKREKEQEANVLRARLGKAEAAFIPSLKKPLVTWKSGPRTHFDEKAFAAAHPDLYRQFQRTTYSRTLRPAKLKEDD